MRQASKRVGWCLVLASIASIGNMGCDDGYDSPGWRGASEDADAGAPEPSTSTAPAPTTPDPAPSDPPPGSPTDCTPADTPLVRVSTTSTAITETQEVPVNGYAWSWEPVTIAGSACTTTALLANGQWVIAGAPTGTFHLVWGTTKHGTDTSARSVDLGTFMAGRPNAATVCDANGCSAAFVTLRLGNLAPWAEGDTVALFVPNTNALAARLEALSLSAPPRDGDTSLALALDWRSASTPALIDASLGDVAYVQQMAASGSGASAYATVARIAHFDQIEQTQEAETVLEGTFDTVAADRTIDVDLRASAFEALAPSVGPAAVARPVSFAVRTLPGATHGLLGAAADLVRVPDTVTDVAPGAIPYGDPYPSSWGTLAVTHVDFQVPYAEGALTVSYVDVQDAAAFRSGPIAPVLGPVQHPLADGRDASRPLKGTSVTTLSWDPPAVGSPSAYVVAVRSPAAPTGAPAAVLTTAATHVTLNGDECGDAPCVFEIDAVASPVDLSAHPNRTSVPYVAAPRLTAELTP